LFIIFFINVAYVFGTTSRSHADGEIKIGTLPVQGNKLTVPLGIEIFGGTLSTIIKAGVELPTSYQSKFGLANNSKKSMTIRLYYGHKRFAQQNELLSAVTVTGFSPSPSIEIRLDLNERGEVFASAQENGKELKVSK